jgi:hypothetical protein
MDASLPDVRIHAVVPASATLETVIPLGIPLTTTAEPIVEVLPLTAVGFALDPHAVKLPMLMLAIATAVR